MLKSAAALTLFSLLPGIAAAQQTFVRPGNEIGTGQSLPLSNKASNIDSATAPTSIAPRLPTPPVPENAPASSYLLAARTSILSGQTGEAQEALERAESRALDRSVRPSTARQPDSSALVRQITAARAAIATGNTAQVVALVDAALRNPASSSAPQ